MTNTLVQEQTSNYDRVSEIFASRKDLMINGKLVNCANSMERMRAEYFKNLIDTVRGQYDHKVAITINENDGLSIVLHNQDKPGQMVELRAYPAMKQGMLGYQASWHFHKGRGDDKEITHDDIFPTGRLNNDSVRRAYCKRAVRRAREHLGLE